MKKMHLIGANIIFATIICIFVMGFAMPSRTQASRLRVGTVAQAKRRGGSGTDRRRQRLRELHRGVEALLVACWHVMHFARRHMAQPCRGARMRVACVLAQLSSSPWMPFARAI